MSGPLTFTYTLQWALPCCRCGAWHATVLAVLDVMVALEWVFTESKEFQSRIVFSAKNEYLDTSVHRWLSYIGWCKKDLNQNNELGQLATLYCVFILQGDIEENVSGCFWNTVYVKTA